MQAPSDDPFYTVTGDTIYGTYIPSDASSGGSSSGGSAPGTGPVVAETSGGITINLLFDAAAMAAPASFRAGIAQAAAILASTISDKITVNLNIDYSGTGGGAAAGPDSGLFENYSTIRSDLVNGATPGDGTFNALPTGSSIQGQSYVAVWNAQLKLWGFLGANDTTTDDGSATFATDISPNLLVGVALHELTHALGRVPYGPQPDIFDLFRFTTIGARLFSGSATAPAAYFSLDGGNTKLADFGQTSDPSDFLNSGVQGPNDPFNEFYNSSTIQGLTAVDKDMLDALGFHTLTPVTTVIQTDGSTSLVEVGVNYYMYNTSNGSGPELNYGGAPVVAGQFGGYAPIGAEQTATGYDVAWKDAASNQYAVWTTDSSGNFVSSTGAIAATSATLETYETTLHQDLNGDGTIGIVGTLIQTDTGSFGSTSLTAVGSNYYLFNGGGTGPAVEFGGVAVVAGQFGGYAPIGAAQTATGYDVAWKDAASNQYAVWTTDSSGNFVFSTGAIAVNSATLETYETTLHQDLNGDGTIGIVGTLIQTDTGSFGSTSLTAVGSNYYLFNGGGTGPAVEFGGVAVVAGQFGGYAPIGAEQTATGYDVAWKDAASNQYAVWTTDSSGNFVSSTGAIAATSATLETYETTLHQDLNGNGTIGIVGTLIQTDTGSFGSTSLTAVGSNYYLFNGGGTGPAVEFGGVAVVAGQFGGHAPIGAVQTATGYDVAWKDAASNQYAVWTTDSSGNFVSSTGAIAANSATLETYETTLHQDLNGDGMIGVPSSTLLEAFGSTSLLKVGSNFYLDSISTGTGPGLNYLHAPVVAGRFGGYAPIGAEQTATGYEIAWKVAGVDQYTVWSTDSNGNYVMNIIGTVSGASVALESLEPSFHQDLNGDGVIGVPAAASASASAPASQGTAVTVVSNDTFVFKPGIGADVVTNAGSASTIELDGFSSVTSNSQLAALLHEAQTGQLQAFFQSTADGHDTIINLGNHDSITLTNIHIADLQAGHFIIT